MVCGAVHERVVLNLGVRLVALIIAALSGITMAVQGTLNAVLGKIIGLLEATLVVHLVGIAFIAILLFLFRLGDGNWLKWVDAPWYVYLGGILGVAIIYGVMASIPKVGVAAATTAIILGQVFTAGLIDHLGLLGMSRIPFTWYRIAGVFFMAGGAWLLLRR